MISIAKNLFARIFGRFRKIRILKMIAWMAKTQIIVNKIEFDVIISDKGKVDFKHSESKVANSLELTNFYIKKGVLFSISFFII